MVFGFAALGFEFRTSHRIDKPSAPSCTPNPHPQPFLMVSFWERLPLKCPGCHWTHSMCLTDSEFPISVPWHSDQWGLQTCANRPGVGGHWVCDNPSSTRDACFIPYEYYSLRKKCISSLVLEYLLTSHRHIPECPIPKEMKGKGSSQNLCTFLSHADSVCEDGYIPGQRLPRADSWLAQVLPVLVCDNTTHSPAWLLQVTRLCPSTPAVTILYCFTAVLTLNAPLQISSREQLPQVTWNGACTLHVFKCSLVVVFFSVLRINPKAQVR